MKLVTWNVNGLTPTLRNVELKHGSLLAFFDALGADVVCFQETKLAADAVAPALKNVPGFESFFSCSKAKKGYSGVATFARLQYAALAAYDDACLPGEGDLHTEGRLLRTDHAEFTLINVYVPNAGDRPDRARLEYKLRWLTALQELAEGLTARGKQVVIAGDINVPRSRQDVHPAIEWEGLYSERELQALAALTCSCLDVWRKAHPDVCDVFTVWNERTNARATNRGLRIDYVLCSSGLAERVESSAVDLSLPQKWSDHAPVSVDFTGLVAYDEAEIPAPAALSSRRQAQRGLRAAFALVSKATHQVNAAGDGARRCSTSNDVSEESRKRSVAPDRAVPTGDPPTKAHRHENLESSGTGTCSACNASDTGCASDAQVSAEGEDLVDPEVERNRTEVPVPTGGPADAAGVSNVARCQSDPAGAGHGRMGPVDARAAAASISAQKHGRGTRRGGNSKFKVGAPGQKPISSFFNVAK